MSLLETFLRESDELIAEFEAQLIELETSAAPAEVVAALFRAAHTLKGSAGMVGLNEFVQFAHALEHVLGRMRDGALTPDASVVDALLSSVDVMRAMVAAATAGTSLAHAPRLPETQEALEQLLGADAAAAGEALPPSARDLRVRIQLACSPERAELDARALLADLAQLGTLRELAPEPAAGVVSYTFVLHTAVRRVDVQSFAELCDAQAEVSEVSAPVAPAVASQQKPHGLARAQHEPPSPATAARPEARTPGRAPVQLKGAGTVRVDSARLDTLVDLSCELAIAAARAEQLAAHGDGQARADALEALGSLVREVQERAMSLRMVAVGELFGRFARPVRDLARELGKQVQFETHGLTTELDRKLLDEFADPLKHMVRNAIAHGIEAPELRAQRGKPREGRLSLSARQESGAAVIEVRDDGAGIDCAAVVAKAVEKGLLAHGAQPSQRETYELLFAPGFSTAKQVDEVSGRGVGLDVLKRKVEALRGSIEIVSELGKGTIFRVRLPVTLAVVDGMHVCVGRETMTIPLVSVVELVDLRETSLGLLEGKLEYLDLRGEVLPIVRLGQVLDLAPHEPAVRNPDTAQAAMIVVVRSERRRFGLIVDKVLGLTRAVIKPLEQSYAFIQRGERGAKRPPGVGGATVLGDGRVGLILDVGGLEAMAFEA